MTKPTRRHRGHAVLAALALTGGLGLIAAAPASADTNTYADTVGEEGTTPATDITAYRVSLDAAHLAVTIWTRGTAATPFPSDAEVYVQFDTNGDDETDFHASRTGSTWDVYNESEPSSLCSATGTGTVSSVSFIVPASCVGSPTQVGAAVWIFGADDSSDVTPPFADPYFSAPVSSGPDVSPTTNPQVAVYRFWSPGFNNAHFFTTNEVEAGNILDNDSNWQYEGAAFSAVAANGETCPEGQPVFRFYSPVFQSHFFTADPTEAGNIRTGDRNWNYEGVAYCSYPTAAAGTTALYRFWSPRFGKHFFTADPTEASNIRTSDRNWNYEGIAYYVLP